MNPNEYRDNMLINLGMSLSSENEFYSNDNSKYNKSILEGSVTIKGENIPLIKSDNNYNGLTGATTRTKNKYISQSNNILSTFDYVGTPQLLVELLEKYAGESVKYFSNKIDMSIETLNLMGTLISRTINNYSMNLNNYYSIHDSNLNTIHQNRVEQENNLNMRDMMMDSNKPVKLKATTTTYESFVTGMPVSHTTYTDETNHYEERMNIANRMANNSSIAFNNEVDAMDKEDANLERKLKKLVVDTIDDFNNKLIDIIVSKNSEYFTKNNYATKEYWKNKCNDVKDEDLPALTKALTFYKININDLIEPELINNIVDYYLQNHAEYQGNDLKLYLKVNHLDKLDLDKIPDLYTALTCNFDHVFVHRTSISEEDKTLINNCMYLTEEQKEKLIKMYEHRAMHAFSNHHTIKYDDRKYKRKGLSTKTKKILIIIGVIVLIIILLKIFGKYIKAFLVSIELWDFLSGFPWILATPIILPPILGIGYLLHDWINE